MHSVRLAVPQSTGRILVADGLRRRAVGIAVVVDLPCFVQHTVFDHFVHAAVNAAVQHCAVTAGQAEAERMVGCLGGPGLAALVAHAAACGFKQLQCADDARQVVGVDLSGVVGVDPLQLGVKCRAALSVRPRL